MKKLLPVIAFLVCFAIGSGSGAIMMKPAHAATDSLATDSLAADSLAADSTHGDSARAGGHAATQVPNNAVIDTVSPHGADPVAPAADTARAHATPNGAATPAGNNASQPNRPAANGAPSIGSMVASGNGSTVSLRPDGSVGAAGTPEPAPDFERLARLLSRMGAREAAKTIEQLPAEHAAKALTQMSDKQAAAVLAQLRPEKAASLLQVVLSMVPKQPAAP